MFGVFLKATQILIRWIPTFLAFPLGGLLSVLALGPIRDPLAAAVSGAMVGSTLGLLQWWALKPLRATFDWVWATGVALMIASPIAWVTILYSTSTEALTLWGLMSGALVGFAQGLSQRLAVKRVLMWTTLSAASWGLAWFISANVIVDAEAGYAIFGSTGALAATAVLALFLNPVFASRKEA